MTLSLIKPQHEQGWMLISVLILVAVLGFVSLQAAQLESAQAMRERERQLLVIGNEFRTAIGQYYELSPGSLKIYPPTLEALLKDDRFIGIQRHLRKIHRDPITARTEWDLIKAPQGGIMGVASQSARKPMKTAGFQGDDVGFANANSYRDWRFSYIPTRGKTK